MAADGSPDEAVGTEQYVYIEVHIDFQGRQDHKVQLVDGTAVVVGTCIVGCRYLLMHPVVLQGISRIEVERLHIEDFLDQPFLMHLYNLPRNAAQRKARVNILSDHPLSKKARHR
ncbi:hypothetical protein SDC9_160724 [bioreactor metagenome]|uniref:Uncharacterized protein n=1 Tax=bioreactor metagenome TaxID=1076179 RepID=A0A645FMH6_9ZZZZ